METSEKVVLREQPEIKDLLQTLMKQGLKKEQRRSYPIVLTSIQISEIWSALMRELASALVS